MTARMIISFSCVTLTTKQEGRRRGEGYIWIIFNTAAAEQTKQRRRRVMHTSEIVMIQTDTDLFFITLTQLLPQVLGLATGAEARDTLTGWAREVSLSYGLGCKEAQAHRQAERRDTEARQRCR